MSADSHKIAIFGDVHGHYELLKALYKKVNDQYSIKTWYGTGDLCDRGPATKDVYQFCIDKKIKVVRGNHDDWFLDNIRSTKIDQAWISPNNGGKNTLSSYGGRAYGGFLIDPLDIPPEHEEYIANMPLIYETPYCYVVHGGISPENWEYTKKKWGKMARPGLVKPYDALWYYRGPQTPLHGSNYVSLDKVQVVGHNFLEKPMVSENHIAIDTGCGLFPEGCLTAVILPEVEFVSVKPSEVYTKSQ